MKNGNALFCGKYVYTSHKTRKTVVAIVSDADCIPFVPLSCTEYIEYGRKESFFVLANKSKETFVKWSH